MTSGKSMLMLSDVDIYDVKIANFCKNLLVKNLNANEHALHFFTTR